jgi:hypothetical protein
VVFIYQEGTLETLARKLSGWRIFTAAFRRRQIENVPWEENGVVIGAANRGES